MEDEVAKGEALAAMFEATALTTAFFDDVWERKPFVWKAAEFLQMRRQLDIRPMRGGGGPDGEHESEKRDDRNGDQQSNGGGEGAAAAAEGGIGDGCNGRAPSRSCSAPLEFGGLGWIDPTIMARMVERGTPSGNTKAAKRGAVRGSVPSAFAAILQYLDGASLIVNQADRYCPSLWAFCRKLGESHFHHAFGVMYLTPASTFAVDLHNDDQDVFLIQLWGRKKWKIYAAPVELIFSEEMVGKDSDFMGEKGSPILECDLVEGDVLYMPRGVLHEASTGDEASLHVTITVPTSDYTWATTFGRTIRRLTTEQGRLPDNLKRFLRSSIMKGNDFSEAEITSNVEALKNELEAQDATEFSLLMRDTLKLHVESVNIRRDAHFNEQQRLIRNNPPALPPVNFNATIQLKPGISGSCSPGFSTAAFQRDSQTLSLEICPTASMLIHTILKGAPCKVEDLPCDDPFERLGVCMVLLSKGLIDVQNTA